jgi:hypothetical protein
MENHKGFSATRNAELAHNAEIVIKGSQEFFIQVKSAAIYDSRLSSSAFRTLCLLLDKVGKKPSQRILQRTMAEHLGVNPRSVKRAVKELIEAGYLGTYRTGRSNGYYLLEGVIVTRGDNSVPSDRTNLSLLQSNNSLSNNSGLSDQLETPESGREVAAADSNPNREKRFRDWIGLTLKPLNAHFSELNVEGINRVKETSEAYSALKKVWELGDSSAVTGQTLLQAYREASFKSNIRKPSGFALKAIPSWLESNLQLKAKPSIPEWCGECESPEFRFRDTPEGAAMRCPKCHPSTLSKASQKPQERLSEVQPLEALLSTIKASV